MEGAQAEAETNKAERAEAMGRHGHGGAAPMTPRDAEAGGHAHAHDAVRNVLRGNQDNSAVR